MKFKKTKIGLIPEDWEVVRLREIFEICSGGTPSRRNKNLWINLTIPWVKTMDLNNSFIYETNEKISKEGLIKSNCKLLPKNSILIAMYGGFNQIGRTGILKIEATTNQAISALIKKVDNIDEKFINYILIFLRNKWKKYAISSRKDPNITKKDIENFLIPLPPLKEQQKIAKILLTCDEMIEKQEKLIKEKEKFKKALIQKLLKVELRMENGKLKKLPKVRFKRFSGEQKNGKLKIENGEWVEKRLGEVLKERKEYSKKNNGMPHLTFSKDGIFPKTEQFNRDFLVVDENKKYKITYLDDICYNPANLKFGVIGRNKYGKGIFSPIYITFEVYKANQIFVEYIVTSNDFINKALKYQEGTVYERMAVKPKDLLRLSIYLPPTLKEQEKIANFLSTIEKEIDLLKLELNEFKKLKKSLMQKLLTGKVRVRV